MASGTPSAQVRIPKGDLVFPPTYAHTILFGENLSGGVKIMLRRNIYPGGARVAKKMKKSHSADHSVSLYITKNTILIDCRSYTLS